jgi:hypothetical protein
MRCDSFVVETDVHFATDIDLLYEAVRKAIETSAELCAERDLSDWRQSAYNVRCLKKAYRRAQQRKRSNSKGMDKGFRSPANQRQLADIIDFPVLPKKGKRSVAEQQQRARRRAA